MFIFIYKFILFLTLVEIIHCEDNPCPTIILDSKENNYYAMIKCNIPDNYNSTIKLDVQLSIANISEKEFQKNIEFLGTLDDIIHKRPLDFKLMVPNYNKILPRITYILINNLPLCVGEPLTGVEIVNTVNLQVLIKQKLNKSGDSDSPNMQYIT